MANLIISGTLKEYMSAKGLTDIVVKPVDTGGCCAGGIEEVTAEFVTDRDLKKRLENSRYILRKTEGIQVYFNPELQYAGEEIRLDYKGLIFKSISVENVYIPSVFSGVTSGAKIADAFAEKND